MLTVMDAVADWRAHKLAYAKAEGSPHGDEEERAQLYKILPAGISQDMLSHAHDQPTAFKLLEWMEEKSLFLQEHGGSAAAHLTEAPPEVPPPPTAPTDNWGYPPPEAYWEEEEPASEEQVARMSDSELLAFVRRGGTFKGGEPTKGGRKGGWRKGGYQTRKGGEPPPRNRSDLRCINCGGKSHTWRDCKEPEVPREKRPCLNCGKPGHLSRDCRQPKALTVDGGESNSKQEDVTLTSTVTRRQGPVKLKPPTFEILTGPVGAQSLTPMDSKGSTMVHRGCPLETCPSGSQK